MRKALLICTIILLTTSLQAQSSQKTVSRWLSLYSIENKDQGKTYTNYYFVDEESIVEVNKEKRAIKFWVKIITRAGKDDSLSLAKAKIAVVTERKDFAVMLVQLNRTDRTYCILESIDNIKGKETIHEKQTSEANIKWENIIPDTLFDALCRLMNC